MRQLVRGYEPLISSTRQNGYGLNDNCGDMSSAWDPNDHLIMAGSLQQQLNNFERAMSWNLITVGGFTHNNF